MRGLKINDSAFRIGLVIFCIEILCLSSPARGDLVANGDFEIVGPNGANTIHDGTGSLSWSAAEDWAIFHNATGSTETNWGTYDQFGLPVIFGQQDSASDHLLRLEISHAGNGLVQTMGPLGSGPDQAFGSLWVYVRGAGQVGVGLGNGGSTNFSAFSQTTNQWELLTFSNLDSPVNEIILYSTSGSAEVFVDFAHVSAVPEPSSAGLCLIGSMAMALKRRRRTLR